MQSSIDQFRDNMQRVRNLHVIYETLSATTVAALDLSDMLRNELVMVVSALDLYIHEVIRLGMLATYEGKRTPTNAFLRFEVTVNSLYESTISSATIRWIEEQLNNHPGFQAVASVNQLAASIRLLAQVQFDKDLLLLDNEIRTQHLLETFQAPDKIAKGIGLIFDFGKKGLWVEVTNHLTMGNDIVKNTLRAIVDRRNKIAHEADIDPTFSTLRAIDPLEVTDAINFIERVVETIHLLVS